ncbi:MAG: pyruvate kinase [Nitrospiraceae bacterium]
MRKAKIVCTIGPASATLEVVGHLLDAGMDVARLNFSHGSHERHGEVIAMLRKAAAERGRAVAILQDVQGPRIRLGILPPDGVLVKAGETIALTGSALRAGGQHGFRQVAATAEAERATTPEAVALPVTYPNLARDLKVGARILIDDGLIEFRVLAIEQGTVRCVVVQGGLLRSNKGLNLPGTVVSAPTLTDKDRADIRFGVAQGVDYIALSFVRSPEDVQTARAFVQASGGTQPLIAKIERAEAIETLPALLTASDGVMVARGDLGVEMGPEAVPILQKRIIASANAAGRLVITATQMLESMTRSPVPTRAEASDVANAVFDGTDAVMLSAETAAGQYPVESVAVMHRLVTAAERAMPERACRLPDDESPRVADPARWQGWADPIAEATCRAAADAAERVQARAIVALTESGRTARLLAQDRSPVSIVALTTTECVRQRLALVWGVRAECVPVLAPSADRVARVEQVLKARELVRVGERIVLVSGMVAGQPGGTNMMHIHEVA